jgi:hypothetical protein
MTVRLAAHGDIVLEGTCPSEDAETLLQHLAATPTARVDLRACEFAHTAVIQVLLAAHTELMGPPAGAALRDWVYPVLREKVSD